MPFTILTGTNNSGKSALQKILTLLKHGYLTGSKLRIERLNITPDLAAEIGSFENLINRESGNKKFELTFFNRVELRANKKGTSNNIDCKSSYYASTKTTLTYQVTNDANRADLIACTQTLSNGAILHFEIEPTTYDPGAVDVAVNDLILDDYRWVIKNIDLQTIASTIRPSMLAEKIQLLAKDGTKPNKSAIDDLLVNTQLATNVLGSEGVFYSNTQSPQQIELRTILANNNIFTEVDFISAYKLFEEKLLLYTLNNNWFSIGVFEPEDVISQASSGSGRWNNFKGAWLEILTNEPFIGDTIGKILIETGEAKTLFDPVIDENTSSLQKFFNYTESYSLNHIMHLGQGISALIKALRQQMGRINLSEDKIEVKRYYLTNDSSNSLFFKYANTKLLPHKAQAKELFINQWLKAFDIADALKIEPILFSDAILGYAYYVKRNGKFEPMVDNGLGINKIIHLIIRLAFADNRSIIILEEPEANLHPAFHSLLAEMLVNSSVGKTFVVETHSEYFIRKLQYLVAKQEVKPDDVNILYFENPHKNYEGEQIKRLEMRPDGILKQDFGTGFFDESVRLTVDLLKLQASN